MSKDRNRRKPSGHVTKYNSTGIGIGAGWEARADTGYKCLCPACGNRFENDDTLIGKERFLEFKACDGFVYDSQKKSKTPCKEYMGSKFQLRFEKPGWN